MTKKPGAMKQAVIQAESGGDVRRVDAEGVTLHEYPDYETYVRIQQDGNKAKLRRQFVKESHIIRLSGHLGSVLGSVTFGLCHGTRAGREQAWFHKHLNGCRLIGTEISETATQFKDTIQWDFHHENPEWVGKADFVYSNSWDHAFNPKGAFSCWIRQLRPGGILILDHTKGQTPAAANALDPFGAELPALEGLLRQICEVEGAEMLPILDFRDNPEYRASVLLARRRQA